MVRKIHLRNYVKKIIIDCLLTVCTFTEIVFCLYGLLLFQIEGQQQWTIYPYPKAALQILRRKNAKSSDYILLEGMACLHHLACNAENVIAFQWLPEHYAVIGIEKLNEAARKGHDHIKFIKMFFAKS